MNDKHNEFYIVALSILSTRGEMSFFSLRAEVEERFGRKINEGDTPKFSVGSFSVRMDELENAGYVTSRSGLPERPEERATGRKEKYFAITQDGHRKRTELAEREQSKEKKPAIEGAPEPV